MKTAPIRFYFHRARVFGWLLVLSIVGYVLFGLVSEYLQK